MYAHCRRCRLVTGVSGGALGADLEALTDAVEAKELSADERK